MLYLVDVCARGMTQLNQLEQLPKAKTLFFHALKNLPPMLFFAYIYFMLFFAESEKLNGHHLTMRRWSLLNVNGNNNICAHFVISIALKVLLGVASIVLSIAACCV